MVFENKNALIKTLKKGDVIFGYYVCQLVPINPQSSHIVPDPGKFEDDAKIFAGDIGHFAWAGSSLYAYPDRCYIFSLRKNEFSDESYHTKLKYYEIRLNTPNNEITKNSQLFFRELPKFIASLPDNYFTWVAKNGKMTRQTDKLEEFLTRARELAGEKSLAGV